MSGRSPSKRRTGGGAALLGNAVLMVLVGLAIAVGASVLLARIQYGFWPWHTPASTRRSGTYYTDAAKIALTVAGGIGGAVALVVSYRRQRLLERDEKGLHDRYGAAAAQLGHDNPTIRLAGVYALANLADEWEPRRQQCVDVLCAYLRMPWDPEPTDKHPLANRSITETIGDVETTYTFPPSLGEQEVRETILRVIAAHLQLPAPRRWQRPSRIRAPWEDIDLDFTAAHLPSIDFTNCTTRASVSFERATFRGESSFSGATFQRGATFTRATFTQEARFDRAIFQSLTWFSGALFKRGACFYATKFRHCTTFENAHFRGDATFTRSTFSPMTTVLPMGATPVFKDTQFHKVAKYSPSTFPPGRKPFDGADFELLDQPTLTPPPEQQSQ